MQWFLAYSFQVSSRLRAMVLVYIMIILIFCKLHSTNTWFLFLCRSFFFSYLEKESFYAEGFKWLLRRDVCVRVWIRVRVIVLSSLYVWYLYDYLHPRLTWAQTRNITCFYRTQTKLQKGNVFTSVCQEFCPWGGVHRPLGRYTPDRHPNHQKATAADGTHTTGMHSCLTRL